MKQVSLVFSTISLLLSGALCVGAYITYQKAQQILNNPEKFVDTIVEKQITKTIEQLPIPKLNNGGSIKIPF